MGEGLTSGSLVGPTPPPGASGGRMAPAGFGYGFGTPIPVPAPSTRNRHPPPYPPAGTKFNHIRHPPGIGDPTGTAKESGRIGLLH